MKNGRDPDWDDPKITSIAAARKKAEAAKRRSGPPAESRSLGQMVAGAAIVLMALGMIVWWARSLMQSMSFAP